MAEFDQETARHYLTKHLNEQGRTVIEEHLVTGPQTGSGDIASCLFDVTLDNKRRVWYVVGSKGYVQKFIEVTNRRKGKLRR